VLKVARKFIFILGKTGNHYDAERFARICYQALTRHPLDPESFEAAEAAINLSSASCNLIQANSSESADIEEAEMLAIEGVRVIEELKGLDSADYGCSFSALVHVLFLKKDYGEDTEGLLEENLSDSIRHNGMDDGNTGSANDYLKRFHFDISDTLLSNDEKTKHLQLSQSHYKELSRISQK
jgi:hypothetical protein